MEAVIQPGKLKGKLIIPPSKSFAHRALICAALAKGRSEIYNCGRSEDINATKSCLEALGVRIEEFSDKLIIISEFLRTWGEQAHLSHGLCSVVCIMLLKHFVALLENHHLPLFSLVCHH